MIMRNIVKIDEEKCNGCGLCAQACAEGAIEIVNGKAKLISEIYCDGLGACIGHCPQDAITIEQRQAGDFDEAATKAHLVEQHQAQPAVVCPGLMTKVLRPKGQSPGSAVVPSPSQLTHWPVQLKLLSPTAPCLTNADLLLVADCVPFAMGDFHNRLLKDHSLAVGCPKLDNVDFHIEKLAAILRANNLKSLTVVHMEVPCCFGLTHVARKAIDRSGANIPFEDVTIDLQGNISKSETIGG
jgi:ferredoxin